MIPLRQAANVVILGLFMFPLSALGQQTPVRANRDLIVLYDFAAGSGQTVHDRSGVGAPLDLVIDKPSSVRWAKGTLAIESAALIASAQPARKVIDAVRKSNAMTLEAWLKPASNSPKRSGTHRVAVGRYQPAQLHARAGQGLL